MMSLAWQLDTIDELAEFRQRLTEAGVLTGESSHGATKSVYGVDPDGNEFEVMWMLPQQEWGRYADAGVVEPLDLDAERCTHRPIWLWSRHPPPPRPSSTSPR